MSLITQGTTIADIYRSTSTNVDGELIETWSTQVNDWVCTKQQRSATESITENVNAYRTIWKFYGEYQDITNKDVVIHSNTTYRILGVYYVRNHHMQIDCELLESAK